MYRLRKAPGADDPQCTLLRAFHQPSVIAESLARLSRSQSTRHVRALICRSSSQAEQSNDRSVTPRSRWSTARTPISDTLGYSRPRTGRCPAGRKSNHHPLRPRAPLCAHPAARRPTRYRTGTSARVLRGRARSRDTPYVPARALRLLDAAFAHAVLRVSPFAGHEIAARESCWRQSSGRACDTLCFRPRTMPDPN